MLVKLASSGYKKNVLADTTGAANKILKARGSTEPKAKARRCRYT